MDSANVNAIISATSGLLGVGVGAWLNHLRELRAERIKDKRESSYLAVVVVAHLDQFVNGCVAVAQDDGTSEGRPAGLDGESYQTTVRPPEFAPLDITVEWRVLPRTLMYEILEIPTKQKALENQLGGVCEFDDPPEYADFFMHRRRGYADLGLKVLGIAKSLRAFAEMPIEEVAPGEWSRGIEMQLVIDALDALEAANVKRQAEFMTKIEALSGANRP